MSSSVMRVKFCPRHMFNYMKLYFILSPINLFCCIPVTMFFPCLFHIFTEGLPSLCKHIPMRCNQFLQGICHSFEGLIWNSLKEFILMRTRVIGKNEKERWRDGEEIVKEGYNSFWRHHDNYLVIKLFFNFKRSEYCAWRWGRSSIQNYMLGGYFIENSQGGFM